MDALKQVGAALIVVLVIIIVIWCRCRVWSRFAPVTPIPRACSAQAWSRRANQRDAHGNVKTPTSKSVAAKAAKPSALLFGFRHNFDLNNGIGNTGLRLIGPYAFLFLFLDERFLLLRLFL